VNHELKLLVEWSSPWEEFKTAIQPALGRSPKPLAGEAKAGLFPYRGMLASWGAEILLFVLIILVTKGLDSMHPYVPPPPAKYDVIYYTGNELPKTADAGGAQAGRSGRSGGREAHHPTQVIHVARGETVREKVVDAPRLNLPRSDAAVANLLAYKRAPGPPPAEGMMSSRRPVFVPPMAAVAPAPDVQNRMRSQPTLDSSVVPPAPTAENMAELRLPGSHPVEVVPPPVSAPEQITTANPRLTLPAPRVVAPAPTQVTRELSTTGPGFGPGDPHKQVIPPPAQLSSATASERRAASGLGNSQVVPPTVQLGSGSLAHQPVDGLGGGTGVVPPPPTVSGGTSLTGRGRGKQGAGQGGLGEIGDVAAPANGGGNGKGAGVVVSSQPGSKVGVPNGATGSLAMSPNGGPNPGLGGSGGGSGIGRDNGPGSGFSGAGPGGGKEGSGHGSDPSARGGISPSGGPGGTGSGAGRSPAMPGVSVSGGSGIVNLPSFGGDTAQAAPPGRSSAGVDDRPGLTVEATPRSGGAFNFYGVLKGDKVYTIYIDTVLGTAVLEFADPTSAQHPNQRDLSPPQPLRADLPAGVRRSRLVIACVLDRAGEIKNAQVMESGGPAMTSKVLAALPSWKFRPAMRGNVPVEVNAILGFDIDTSDR
jgi:hypothetical protein